MEDPILVAAFEGWTDAGNAASSAATYLAEKWGAEEFALVNGDEFYDFTTLRPQVRLDANGSREIVWTQNRFLASSRSQAGGQDVVFLIGSEPHLRWRTFSRCVTEVAASLKVQFMVTLGAMLTDLPHTRTSLVRGTTNDQGLIDRFRLVRSQYQGPTGIVGVLQDAFHTIDVPVVSFMAQVPHYVSGTPSPKATLALVERVRDLLAIDVETAQLQLASAAYERQVSEVVASDEDISRYVHELERRFDENDDNLTGLSDLPSGDALAAELERFLREQGGSSS
ncbi:MAG: PAC2 family protein [Acidimicrobiales bacterium]